MKSNHLVGSALLATTVALFATGLLLHQRDEDAKLQAAASGKLQSGLKGLLALMLPDAEGRLHAFADWRGKILVVNYWATWCGPCRDEMPDFSSLQEKYSANGVQFVGISTDDAAKVRDFTSTYKIRYPLLIGDMNAMQGSSDLGNAMQALPFTVLIERDGKLHSTKLGRFNREDLEQRLTSLVSQK